MSVDNERRAENTPPQFEEGPFIISLGIGGKDSHPRTTGRWILGGPEGAEAILAQALEDINKLPDGLSWGQLQEEVSVIFKSRGLSRVDF